MPRMSAGRRQQIDQRRREEIELQEFGYEEDDDFEERSFTLSHSGGCRRSRGHGRTRPEE